MSDSTKLTGAAATRAAAKAEREAAEAAEREAAEANEREVEARKGAAPVVSDPDASPRDVDRIAQSVVDTIPPAQAESQAEVSEHASKHSGDAQQAELEARIAELLRAKAKQHRSDEAKAAARRRAHGPAPTHKPGHVPALGGAIPHTLGRFSFVSYHTAPDTPDQPAIVLRRWPKDSDGNRYFADLGVWPQISGSAPYTVEGATYGPGQGQFSEPSEDEDDWNLDKPYDQVRTWKHE